MTKRTYTPAPSNVALANIIASFETEKQVAIIKRLIGRLYFNQEVVERQTRSTVFDNKVGFNKADALGGTELAEKIMAGVASDVEVLAWGAIRPNGTSRISKYWKQFINVSL